MASPCRSLARFAVRADQDNLADHAVLVEQTVGLGPVRRLNWPCVGVGPGIRLLLEI